MAPPFEWVNQNRMGHDRIKFSQQACITLVVERQYSVVLASATLLCETLSLSFVVFKVKAIIAPFSK